MIQVENVCKSFFRGANEIPVLRNVDLSINKGEFVSIMGPSGSGKSTLLYLMGGLDRVTSGQIKVCGEIIDELSDDNMSVMRRRDIGFVFQNYNLIDNLSVEENILLPLNLDRVPKKVINERLEKILRSVHLEDRRHHTPKELSGGQQQRVAIARALITEPSVLLADEPIGNLDSQTGEDILMLLKQINEDYGITIVMVTHNEKSSTYGNRVIHLKDGGITSHTTIELSTIMIEMDA